MEALPNLLTFGNLRELRVFNLQAKHLAKTFGYVEEAKHTNCKALVVTCVEDVEI